jgi:hypothetical protein
MMQFKVTKVITAKSGKGGWKGILYILLLLPLLLLLMVASLIFIPFFALRSLFVKRPASQAIATEDDGILLAGNDKVTVRITRDEKDKRFEIISSAWNMEVLSGRVHVYRAITSPYIADLHDQFITYFCKETKTGVFLQMVEVHEHAALKINTKLVFLDYTTQSVADVVNVGPYMLFADKKSEWVVRGYNNNDEIELSLTYRND